MTPPVPPEVDCERQHPSLHVRDVRAAMDRRTPGRLHISNPVEFRGVFAALRDEAEFARVKTDSDSGTNVWPNGADLDQDVLLALVSGRPIVESKPDQAVFPPE